MGKGLIFFSCACCILVLTIVNLSIGPIISGKTNIKGTLNCAALKDADDAAKDLGATDDARKYTSKWVVDECVRKKGLHDMEYTSFIFDIVIGFICGLIGLLHLFEVKKEFVSNTGLIGLICGVIGFVLTFVYVIFNGLVYTTYYEDKDILKRDGDGIVAELKGDKYECKYFNKKGDIHAFIAEYSDLNKKQYNYDKDLTESYTKDEVDDCQLTGPCSFNGDYNAYATCVTNHASGPKVTDITILCDDEDNFPAKASGTAIYYYDSDTSKICKNLYAPIESAIKNKDISDRFLTALILSLFVCLANIGLALFGFLLFRTPGDF